MEIPNRAWRWQDSSELEHHCPICKTPLTNPKAISTCVGIHVEICKLYHQHFFHLGGSHDCKSCIKRAEMHWKRRAEIADFIILLREHDDRIREAFATPTRRVSRGRPLRRDVMASSDTSSPSPSSSKGGLVASPLEESVDQKDATSEVDLSPSLPSDQHSRARTSRQFMIAVVAETFEGYNNDRLSDFSPKQKQSSKLPRRKTKSPEAFLSRPSQRRNYGVKNKKGGNTSSLSPPGGESDMIAGITDGNEVLEKLLRGADLAIVNPLDKSKKRKEMLDKIKVAVHTYFNILNIDRIDDSKRELGFWRYVKRSTLSSQVELLCSFSWHRTPPPAAVEDTEEDRQNVIVMEDTGLIQDEGDMENAVEDRPADSSTDGDLTDRPEPTNHETAIQFTTTLPPLPRNRRQTETAEQPRDEQPISTSKISAPQPSAPQSLTKKQRDKQRENKRKRQAYKAKQIMKKEAKMDQDLLTAVHESFRRRFGRDIEEADLERLDTMSEELHEEMRIMDEQLDFMKKLLAKEEAKFARMASESSL